MLVTVVNASRVGITVINRALAARVVFAISPNSASCERVFALLKRLFGEQQISSLADLVQTALMLNCNQRAVG